jgi:multidrug resistance efflux pump
LAIEVELAEAHTRCASLERELASAHATIDEQAAMIEQTKLLADDHDHFKRRDLDLERLITGQRHS